MSNKESLSDKEALQVVIRYCRGSRVQKKVAEKGGLDPSTMSQFARGHRFPRVENLKKLAEAFDCSLPTLKGAIAQVQFVAELGGDERAQFEELDKHFMEAKYRSAAAQVGQVPDPRAMIILKNLMEKLGELISYHALRTDGTNRPV